METTNFEEALKIKCAPLDEMLCDLKKSDEIMKEFITKRDILGIELWTESAKLMVDGYKSQLLQAIVAIEDLKNFVNSNNSRSELKDNMLAQLNEWHALYKEEYERNRKLREIVRQHDKRKGDTECGD